MCVDYTYLYSAFPKDAYPLLNIDKLVDNSSSYKLSSFMDAYFGYNQIPMADEDKEKTAFMTESGNYYYNVIPFGLRNAGATYQRMMNKVYDKKLLGDILEVYMDDMIFKSHQEIDHVAHLKRVFEQTRKYNMRLNLENAPLESKRVISSVLPNRKRDWGKSRQMPSFRRTYTRFQEMHPNAQRNVNFSLPIRRKVRSTRSPFLQTLEERDKVRMDWRMWSRVVTPKGRSFPTSISLAA